MTEYFQSVLRRLNNRVEKDLELSIVDGPRSTRGDITTVAELEGYESQDRYDITQTTVQIINSNGAVYAEVIIHMLERDSDIALLSWVEVVDEDNQSVGIGTSLHKEAISYTEDVLEAETIYTKVKNTKMESVNTDTSVKLDNSPGKYSWYKREV